LPDELAVGPADLPEASAPRTDRRAQAGERRVSAVVQEPHLGTRPDQTHMAGRNKQQLRQFIEMRRTKEAGKNRKRN
jgi:hypothetical protein